MDPIASTVYNRFLSGAGQADSDMTEKMKANIAEAGIWKMMAEATSYLQKLNGELAANITKNQVGVTESLIRAYA